MLNFFSKEYEDIACQAGYISYSHCSFVCHI